MNQISVEGPTGVGKTELAKATAQFLEPQLVADTLNVLLKFEGDMASVTPKVGELTHKAREASAARG